MEDTFVLRIQIGNDAMQSGDDIARALRATADDLLERDSNSITTSDYGYVKDINGNNVGSWEVQ